jgi:EAL domain-containing protein (putative c-di-GMP-specific phosphodiesterase class I)
MAEKLKDFEKFVCKSCAAESDLDFDFTMAFQPIVNVHTKEIFGYEALVRGLNNEPAYSIISRVSDDNRYIFDQLCRVKAIALASSLGIKSMLSINFLPNAVYIPERCIQSTLKAAREYDFPADKIMFEFTEVEKIEDSTHVKRVVEYYKSIGFKTAIDDFGAGYAGLNLLADFQTHIAKLDMGLIRNIHQDSARQSIVKHTLNMLRELNICPLAEGIETEGEFVWLRDAGVELMQGYLFARPSFESLPIVDFSSY